MLAVVVCLIKDCILVCCMLFCSALHFGCGLVYIYSINSTCTMWSVIIPNKLWFMFCRIHAETDDL